jgi:hypothetical protein
MKTWLSQVQGLSDMPSLPLDASECFAAVTLGLTELLEKLAIGQKWLLRVLGHSNLFAHAIGIKLSHLFMMLNRDILEELS